MAKSERIKKLHATQRIAAQEQFESYKDFIVKEFVDAFGSSYQTADSVKDNWRNDFVFNAKCEKFLLDKTNLFLRLLPCEHNYQSPNFLRNLTSAISEYLSKYICQKGIKRNDCTRQLIQFFFTDNSYIQSQIKSYHKQNQEDDKQKARTESAKKKAVLQKTPEAIRKTEQKMLRKKLNKHHVQIFNVKIYVDGKAR